MKFEIERRRITIAPENALDEAFIEEVLGLKKNGQYLLLEREDLLIMDRSFQLITKEPTQYDNSLAYLEAKKEE